MSLSFVYVYTLFIIGYVSFAYAAGDGKCGLNEHDMNVVCIEALKCGKFCDIQGAADDGCKKIAAVVKGGTEATCSATNVCSFTNEGKPVFVASKKQDGATVFKDCKKGFSIIDHPGSGSPSNSNAPPKSGSPTGSPTGSPSDDAAAAANTPGSHSDSPTTAAGAAGSEDTTTCATTAA